MSVVSAVIQKIRRHTKGCLQTETALIAGSTNSLLEAFSLHSPVFLFIVFNIALRLAEELRIEFSLII